MRPAGGLTVSPLAVEPVKTTVDQTLLHSPHSDSVESDDFQEYQEFQAASHEDAVGPAPVSSAEVTEKAHGAGTTAKLDSSACDSLAYAGQVNNFAPSMASSGYASQAVSIQTLSSEDSGSVKSIGTDDILVDVSMATVEKKATIGGSEDAVEKEGVMDQNKDDSSGTTADVSSEKEGLTNQRVNEELRVDEISTAAEPSSVPEIELHVSESCQDSAGDNLVSTDSVNESSASDVVEQDNFSSANGVSALDETSNVCETKLSNHEDEVAMANDKGKKSAEETIDFYSETAMEELERMSDDNQDTSAMKTLPCSTDLQSNIATNGSNKTSDVPTKLPNEESSNSAITEKVKLRRKGSGPRNTQSRRSLNVELETSMAATENGGRYPEIKAGVDFMKGANFKKLRPMVDSRPSKGSPSPVKATYRPVSMTQEMMLSLEEAMQPDEEEAHNSGLLSITCFKSGVISVFHVHVS